MAGPSDLGASYFCEWALGMCTTVTELKAAVLNGTCLIPADGVTGLCCDWAVTVTVLCCDVL